MKIVCIGGGPAGLYFSILMKKADPSHEIVVHEQNRSDDTFGWGVVFSKETLTGLDVADPETFEAITKNFAYWDDIDTFLEDECVTSTGHGFCGMSRRQLLNIMQDRARDLGVELHFESQVTDPEAFPDADLVIGCDGVNSMIRERYQDHFKPDISWGNCRFSWLGTDLPLESFTFFYRENEHGLFQVHAYPFEEGCSTFIVECHEDTWKRAGLDQASEEETVRYCNEVFKKDLKGHKLLTNRSIWRSFPTIHCDRWHRGNLVLLGDAVHTAHFSIGSGTKLAMEDAIKLRDAFAAHQDLPVEGVLQAYHDERRDDVARLQKTAWTSRMWFENSRRYLKQHPIQFTFNETTRSKRITWDNLALRDPAFISKVAEWFAESAGAKAASDGSVPPPIFTSFKLRELELQNRVVVSPMCMYSADDGTVGDWHLVHLGSRAVGGAGLIITEMTDVSREGRISPGCAGMYKDEHVDAWRKITEFVHQNSASKIGIQLAHAGPKGSCKVLWEGMDEPLESGNWPIVSASAVPYLPDGQIPREASRADMDEIKAAFVSATSRAEEAGFDLIELHMAHGYLLSAFITPHLNHRTDEYGGSLENRMRFPLEVLDAMREAWPAERPMSVRISATDWTEHGVSADDAVSIARMLKEHAVDLIDVSAGQTTPEAAPIYGRMFQVPFSEQIRHEVGIPTLSVGAIQNADQANTIVAAGRADLCAMARPHLSNPYITLHAAKELGYPDAHWPPQYISVR